MAFEFATIFDMDGVLIDSYRAHYQSWVEMARGHGLSISEQQFKDSFGRTSRESMAQYWGPRRFSDEDVQAMDQEKEAAFRRIIAANFPAMRGGVELVAALHQAGFGVAVGSSAPRENLALAIDRLGVRDRLDAVVTGSDVQRGKPDPQIFLVAAERLDVLPARCVVIEDAPVGIAAAAAAGMACVGLASTGRTREVLSKAQLVVDSLTELSPEVLRQAIERHADRQAVPSAKAVQS
ncbi:MAG: HAD family phosphatase [Thermoguttaceae bacterium]|jgi:beta-phosphoglucomutase